MASLPPDPTSPETAGEPSRPDAISPPSGPLPSAPLPPEQLPPDVLPRDAARRAQRRRWRRRRRVLGTLAFLAVAVALVYVVARAAGVGDSDDTGARAPTSTTEATTTTLPLAGPYRVLDGLNARSGPGSTFPVLGTIRIGETVMVMCVASGDLVDGPSGQSTAWLKVATPLGPVFVTAAYVAVGADLDDPGTIAPCAP